MITRKSTYRATMAAVTAATLTVLSAPLASAVHFGPGPKPAGPSFTEPNVLTGKEGDLTKIPETAKLKITKLTPSSKTAKNDGTEISDVSTALPGSKGIKGVTFTAYKVEGIDLSTNVGWREAADAATAWKKLSAKEKEDATQIVVNGGKIYTISTSANTLSETNEQGVATSTDLPRGLYVVKESIAKNVTIDGKQYPGAKVKKASPFVVALPMTDQNDTTKWLKTVNVYPKNSVADIEKTVHDSDTPGAGNKADSKIKYSINSEVTPNTAYDNFQIVDPLDARLKLDNVDSDVAVNFLAGSEDKSSSFSKGTDYTVHAVPVTPAPSSTNENPKVGTWLSVKLTKEGLEKLKSSGVTKVTVDLTATLKKLDEAKSDIANKALLLPNKGWDEKNPSENPGDNPGGDIPNIPTDTVVSKYGKVELTKVSKDDKKKLEGAKFQLFECDAKGTLGKQVSVNDQNEWTTAKDTGLLSITGLHLNDFQNNSTGVTTEDAEAAGSAAGAAWKDNSFYCLVESQAPAGYEKLTNPIKFQLLQADQNYTKALTVENVPNNGGFNLPLTGGKGVVPLIALGGLLVVGAAGYAAVASRRNRSEA